MDNFWESLFESEKDVWGWEPSNSSLKALELFQTKNINSILIPGFGYDRNATVFINNNIITDGIEISQSAINIANKHINLNGTIYHGSVNNMPYSNKLYGGIFCYALVSSQASSFGQKTASFLAVTPDLGVFPSDSEGICFQHYILDTTPVHLFDKSEQEELIKFKSDEPTLKYTLTNYLAASRRSINLENTYIAASCVVLNP